jgi:FtsP/CotA-like multicopper oxidase with cupredoxin domain
MITDRAFDADGAFRYPAVDPTLRGMPGVQPDYVQGVLGDVVLVNGAPWPVLDVGTGRYRLRILNASNARRYRIALSPALPFTQIGSDGGLLARPVSHQAIDIAPAERFDVVVDFAGCRVGQEITMTNLIGTGSTGIVMRFRVTHNERDDSRIPDRLAEIETLDPARATVVRDWRFSRGKVDMPGMPGMPGWLINGKPFDPTRMDANPKLGDIEIWRFHTDLHHPIHVHLAPFQVLHRDAGGPGEYDGGWKDTIDLKPTEQAEVAIRFTGYQGHYLLHCHNMEHEDMAMMSAFRTE